MNEPGGSERERREAFVRGEAWGRIIGLGWSIRVVSEATGVAQSTLRSWERRYGLKPSDRTDGGHRRYSAEDLDRIRLMCCLLDAGATTADAARQARAGTDADVREALRHLRPPPTPS